MAARSPARTLHSLMHPARTLALVCAAASALRALEAGLRDAKRRQARIARLRVTKENKYHAYVG